MIQVSDIKEELKEVTGLCDDAAIYRTLTRAIEALSTSGLFDPQIGYLDFYVNSAYTISLPRDVKTPLRINLNANPSFHRSKVFEFALNTEGSVTGEEVGWSWSDRHYSPVQEETLLPAQIRYVSEDSEDDDTTIAVTGIDEDGNEITETLTATSSYGTSTDSTNFFVKVTRVVKPETAGITKLMTSADDVLARYYPDETLPNYRLIKLSKTGVAIRMMYRKHVFKITSDDDVIPVDSTMAILTMCDSIRLLMLKKWNEAAVANQAALGFLKSEQASRDEGDVMAEALEIATATDNNITTRDSLIVADIYDEAADIFGAIGRSKLLDRITAATEVLANNTQWDSMIGYCDVWKPSREDLVTAIGSTTGDGVFVLPRFVEAPLAINFNGIPSSPRSRWFEFHMNGLGIENPRSVVNNWEDIGDMVTCDTIRLEEATKKPTPTIVAAVAAIAGDENAAIKIYGKELNSDGIEVDVWRDGSKGWTCPCKLDVTVLDTSDYPAFTAIERITRDATTDFVSLVTLTAGSPNVVGYTMGVWYPDEREPKYRAIKVQSSTEKRIRIKYRRRWSKFTSLYDPIHLRSRQAIVAAMRSIKAAETDTALADSLEARALRLLSDEQRTMNPHNNPSLQFESALSPGDNSNIQ